MGGCVGVKDWTTSFLIVLFGQHKWSMYSFFTCTFPLRVLHSCIWAACFHLCRFKLFKTHTIFTRASLKGFYCKCSVAAFFFLFSFHCLIFLLSGDPVLSWNSGLLLWPHCFIFTIPPLLITAGTFSAVGFEVFG